jgi:putative transposase
MSRDTTVIRFRQPEVIDDPLSEVAREGARRMLGAWAKTRRTYRQR